MFLPPRSQIDQMASEEFGEQTEPQQQVDEQTREERILSSVENRLQKANYYRLVLENPLFSDGESSTAYEVEAEFRNFALERLQTLMGERPERSELDMPDDTMQVLATFTPQQLLATKLWAEKMLERDPNIKPVAAPSAPPKLNPVQQTAPPPPSLNVVKAEKKPRARKQPKIEPRKPSILAQAAQQVRQVQQAPVSMSAPAVPPRIQPRQPTTPQAPMPQPSEVLEHFQGQQLVAPPPPIAQPVQQPRPVQKQEAEPPAAPVQFSTPDEQAQAQANAEGGMTDHLGRSYEIREYVDHRTGEVKKHKVYHNSQIFPKGDLAKNYQVPSEKAAIAALAEKDTEGAVAVVRTGPNPWDKGIGSVQGLGLGSALNHFQIRNRNVAED